MQSSFDHVAITLLICQVNQCAEHFESLPMPMKYVVKHHYFKKEKCDAYYLQTKGECHPGKYSCYDQQCWVRCQIENPSQLSCTIRTEAFGFQKKETNVMNVFWQKMSEIDNNLRNCYVHSSWYCHSFFFYIRV